MTTTLSQRIKKYPDNLVYQIKSYEKIPCELFHNSADGCIHIAQMIALAIRGKQQKGEKIVLGLATGSSPIQIYRELVRIHKEENLSFSNVITFNLDEYYPMQPDAMQSYHRFMHEYLFDHIDIPKEQIHIPDGTLALDAIRDYCVEYDRKIQILGGIDIQILGIGRTGHIAFNEPGSEEDSRTRLVRLDNITRSDASSDFGDMEHTPYKAITMGVKTIMAAKEIYIVAWGQHKAEIVQRALEGPIDNHVSATYLQKHENVTFYLDTAAAQKLTRVKTPWRVGSCEWDKELQSRAVIWLSHQTNKPILKLTEEDYNEHGLSELLLEVESAYQLNINIFNKLQQTITGWPGGKPNTDDTYRPERATPAKKRVLIFSPHPDDDVISMGGTLLRLIKGLIRKGEATSAARFCGIEDQNIHFLNLPFYETGRVKKNGLSKADIQITMELLQQVKPHQIFAAGDLADPHGTHRICLNAIIDSLADLKAEKWTKSCWMWLYRGAWQEFEVSEIEMAVPLSPKELLKKRNAIFMHQSQKDKPPFPGSDEREFWQRSEDRNRNTAKGYRDLGFAEYEAMEAFRRWVF